MWIHMRPKHFPQKKSSKLAPRGDGPFQIIEKINENAYLLILQVSLFNVTDLSTFLADGPILRSKPSEEGGNDEVIGLTKDQPHVPEVKESPMTH